jgi:NADH-quinone oxidoreductase subunit L
VIYRARVPAPDVFAVLWGDPFALTRTDLIAVAAFGAALIAFVALAYRRIAALLFDQEVAASSGVAVRRLRTAVLLAVGCAVAFAMKLIGALLLDAILLLPAILALAVARSVRGLFLLAAVAGLGVAAAGFMVALMLVFTSFGTLSYTEVLHEPGQVIGATTATAIGLLLLVGAAGKSAQLPLYVWLPDAMEGPTPVSALIHAATMVTAGVYMVARTGAIYGLSDVAGGVVATVGALTALLAATIAIAQRDIKRVLAYSTISQLGYMFMAVGIGGYVAGLFHLVTHAVFKALLFLGAGSVIHALADEQDMTRMGGLRSKMPITHATMLVATLSIAGIPPLAGFWSKDEILAVLFAKGGYFTLLWGIGLLTALLTAFYMARQYFLVFDGKARWDDGVHPHESPKIMTGPLVVLGVLTVLIGFVNTPFRLSFEHFLEPAFEGVYLAHAPEDGFLLGALALVSVAAGMVGIAIAFLLYRHASEETRERLLGKVRRPLMAWENGYWVDDVYGALIVKPGMRIALWSARAVDQRTIDGLVNGVGVAVRSLGRRLRPLQSGFVRSYGAVLAAGAVGIVAWIVARGL